MKYITAVFPLHILPSQKIISNGSTIHLPCECLSTWSLRTESYTQILSFKTVTPPLKFVPNFMITYNKSFCYLWTWFLFLGWVLYNLPPMTAKYVKQVLPIIHFCGLFYLAVIILHLWCSQYFVVPIWFMNPKKFSASWAKYISHFYFITISPLSPS